MKILVTGAAGFIGFHLVNYLAKRGNEVIGLDNINYYYDVNLKLGRLKEAGIPIEGIADNRLITSEKFPNYQFVKIDLTNRVALFDLFEEQKFDRVCHLAAQAGVRYSLENPSAYIESNLIGFMNILEACRKYPVEHLAYASSSSIYGLNKQIPFSTHHSANHPISLYAATKKSNEMLAHTYSHLFDIPTTGLRFFTVYGPWGRPDMALFIFTKKILEGETIDVYNHGNMMRDFTYVDDIVEGVVKVIDNPSKPDENWNPENPDPSSSTAPFKVYNIGNSKPVKLMDFIEAIEKHVGKEAKKNMMPIQPGDVEVTYANVSDLTADLGFKPDTPIEEGVGKFVEWYKKYYKVK